MSRKYKFYNKEGLYFVSFATIHWIDVFIRDEYCQILLENLSFCRREKGMEIYCWCIMPSHMHMIFRDKNNDPGKLLGQFKSYTSKRMREAITDNFKESRRKWITDMMKTAGLKNSNVQGMQFWQQHNHPIELWSAHIIDQKVDYIHKNPVKACFVLEPHYWKYSSAVDYSGGKGLLEIDFV